MGITSLLNSMFKKTPKSELTITFAYHPKISRLFIFRPLWIIIAVWPMWIVGVWFGLLSFIHFWLMLILGERSEPIWKYQMACIRYYAAWWSYLHFFIDTRPSFWLE